MWFDRVARMGYVKFVFVKRARACVCGAYESAAFWVAGGEGGDTIITVVSHTTRTIIMIRRGERPPRNRMGGAWSRKERDRHQKGSAAPRTGGRRNVRVLRPCAPPRPCRGNPLVRASCSVFGAAKKKKKKENRYFVFVTVSGLGARETDERLRHGQRHNQLSASTLPAELLR